MGMPEADSADRAENLSLAGLHCLLDGEARDAAWFSLAASELDPNQGLAWAVLAQLVREVSEDPLATIATRYALGCRVPDSLRPRLERYERIDRWTRGLVRHRSRAALLQVKDFDRPAAFESTFLESTWYREQLAPWGSEAAALQGLRRLAGALSDALAPPQTNQNPLKAEGWAETDAYQCWKSENIEREFETPEVFPDAEDDMLLISDHWMEQDVFCWAANGQFAEALKKANLWEKMRPDAVRPLLSKVRLYHATDKLRKRDQCIEAVLKLGLEDLAELELVRNVLGELKLWSWQVKLLDQMDALAPSSAVILANRGAAYIEIGNTDAGARDLEAALAADPDCGPALANLGLQRMREDDYVRARDLLERAVAQAPDQAQVRVYLAACKNNQGSRAAAIEELEEALRLEPDHPQAHELLAELRGFDDSSEGS